MKNLNEDAKILEPFNIYYSQVATKLFSVITQLITHTTLLKWNPRINISIFHNQKSHINKAQIENSNVTIIIPSPIIESIANKIWKLANGQTHLNIQ